MKIILLLFLTACVSIIQAQEIQGIFNYRIGGGYNITINRLTNLNNIDKRIQKQKLRVEKFNLKHPKNKIEYNEQVQRNSIKTIQHGLYAGFFRIGRKDDNYQNSFYLGYMWRLGYGVHMLEPFFGIQNDVFSSLHYIDGSGEKTIFPFSIAYKIGLDFNITKKIAFNTSLTLPNWNFDENNYRLTNIFFGVRYSLVNKLKR